MAAQTIRAIRVHNYGGLEQLELEQAPLPLPREGEVLVRVYAAGVNPVDWKIREGWLREFVPMQFPYIPGQDIAGVVEAVGPGVTAFQPGQAVFGQSASGAYAEYTTASVNMLAFKPEKLSMEEAATIPIGATTAWQGLFDHGGLQPCQRVLILGASGGVGLFAVQFAHWKGAHVIGTTSIGNLDFVRALGAETVIDYKTTQVESAVHDVDLVLDTVGGEALARVWSALKRGGILVSVAGRPDQIKAENLGVRATSFSAQVSSQLLHAFARLIDEGQIKVIAGEQFPLNEARKAQELCQSGHGRGRIVLRMAE